ncbi:MAG: hypothetical protein ACTSU8_02130 [Alphaproteobacteria bacterium]
MKPPVYIDELKETPGGERCHLFAGPGGVYHLHEFARLLGLQKSEFVASSYADGKITTLPHYNLTRCFRWKAIAFNAILAEPETVEEVWNEWFWAILVTA